MGCSSIPKAIEKEKILECIVRKDNPGLISKKVSEKLYNSIARIEFENEDENKNNSVISTSFFIEN